MNLRDKIKAGEQFMRGGVVSVSSPDLFPTPPEVAARVASYLELFDGCSVLEPSIGTGSLMRAILEEEPGATVQGYDVSRSLAEAASATWADFLEVEQRPEFDRVAMNPPFSKGADMRHVSHALGFLKPGGVLVAIVADGPRQDRYFERFEDIERLPSGTFNGTGVRSRIIRYRAR